MIPADTPVGQKLISEHQSALPVTPVATLSQAEISTKPPMSTKKKALIIGGIVIGFIVIVGMFDESSVAPSTPVTTTPQVVVTEKPLDYEVVKKIPGGTTLVMRVYTTEKENERIIKLTDKLFDENKKGLTHLMIDYFDDKQLASNYFDQLLDEKISEAKKDEMFTHYIANLRYNTTTNNKVLVKNQNGDWIELKKY